MQIHKSEAVKCCLDLKEPFKSLLWPQPSNLRPFTLQIHEHSLDCNEQLNRCIRWADALVIVFSITDYKSYELLSHLYHHVRQMHPGNAVPVVIVANKADLLHVKEVEPQHGLQLANMLGCAFYEVSVSENYNDVFNAFHVLCKEVSKQQTTNSTPERRRTSLIPRPKSPNMQDLKRRFKQALSAKVRTVTSVWQQGQEEALFFSTFLPSLKPRVSNTGMSAVWCCDRMVQAAFCMAVETRSCLNNEQWQMGKE